MATTIINSTKVKPARRDTQPWPHLFKIRVVRFTMVSACSGFLKNRLLPALLIASRGEVVQWRFPVTNSVTLAKILRKSADHVDLPAPLQN